MAPLPRLERGDSDGVFTCVPPWTDLGAMLQSVVEGVKETGEPVLSSDHVQTRCVGFYMEQLKDDNIHSWEWEIHCDDLNRCLATPECSHLKPLFRSATGRAQIAATLSKGTMP